MKFKELIKYIFSRTYRNYRRTNTQYHEGGWTYIKGVPEAGRYSVTAGYISLLAKNPSILDVGCGEGVLLERLGSFYSKYTGIDFSEAAISRLKNKSFKNAEFIVSEAETYLPREKFDVIVFMESMYYFNNPLKTMLKYSQFLNENGIIIVSMFNEKQTPLWYELEKHFSLVDAVKIIHCSGMLWNVKVFKPK